MSYEPNPAWEDRHGLYSEPRDDDAMCNDDVDDELDCCRNYAQVHHCIEFREGYASTASLHNAAVLGDVARVEELLASGVDANMTDGVKATPLPRPRQVSTDAGNPQTTSRSSCRRRAPKRT